MVWVLVLVPVLPLVVCRGNLFAKRTRRSLSHNKVLVVTKKKSRLLSEHRKFKSQPGGGVFSMYENIPHSGGRR